MKVKELREALKRCNDDDDITIAVQNIAGYVCPDGMTVGIDRVRDGIDWHMNEVIIIPKDKLCRNEDIGKEKKVYEYRVHYFRKSGICCGKSCHTFSTPELALKHSAPTGEETCRVFRHRVTPWEEVKDAKKS